METRGFFIFIFYFLFLFIHCIDHQGVPLSWTSHTSKEKRIKGRSLQCPCPATTTLGTPVAPLTAHCPQWPACLASVYRCYPPVSRVGHPTRILSRLVQKKERGGNVCQIKCLATPGGSLAQEGKKWKPCASSETWTKGKLEGPGPR